MAHDMRAGVAGLALYFAAGAAGAVTYECTIQKTGSQGGWIPEIVLIEHDTAQGRALVADPLVMHFIGAPIEARVDTDNAKRTTFAWDITNTIDPAQQYANMEYRLTYLKGTGRATITGNPAGYIGPYTGNGACKVIAE